MLTTDLSSHLALVTGATGGIGQATCRSLASLGCSIAVHYHSAESDATNLVRDIGEKYKVNAEAYQADLGNYDEVPIVSFPNTLVLFAAESRINP